MLILAAILIGAGIIFLHVFGGSPSSPPIVQTQAAPIPRPQVAIEEEVKPQRMNKQNERIDKKS